jgi:hypothetical protein
MQSMKKLLFLVTGLLAFQSTHTVIVRGEIWRKKRDDGSYCYVYGMYDIHIINIVGEPQLASKLDFKKLFDFGDNQYKTLVQNLKKLSPKKVAVLVEDSYSYASGTLFLPSGFSQMINQATQRGAKVDVLHEIASKFKRDGIEPINIDYRQKRMAAVSYDDTLVLHAQVQGLLSDPIVTMIVHNPVFDELRKIEVSLSTLSQYDSRMNFKMQVILDEFEDEVGKIKTYSDSEVLSSYYAKQIQRTRLQGKETYLLMQRAKEQKYTTFLSNVSPRFSKRFRTTFVAYGGMLVEMNALHEIYQSMHTKDKVFLIAGSAHVCNTVNVLQQLGYERVYETGAMVSQLKPVYDSLEAMYDTDIIMSMQEAEYSNVISDLSSSVLNNVLLLLQKRMVFNPKFFDLMLADNPEEGWALGHGPIQ